MVPLRLSWPASGCSPYSECFCTGQRWGGGASLCARLRRRRPQPSRALQRHPQIQTLTPHQTSAHGPVLFLWQHSNLCPGFVCVCILPRSPRTLTTEVCSPRAQPPLSVSPAQRSRLFCVTATTILGPQLTPEGCSACFPQGEKWPQQPRE